MLEASTQVKMDNNPNSKDLETDPAGANGSGSCVQPLFGEDVGSLGWRPVFWGAVASSPEWSSR